MKMLWSGRKLSAPPIQGSIPSPAGSCAALTGLLSVAPLFPGLTPWALLLHPFGVVQPSSLRFSRPCSFHGRGGTAIDAIALARGTAIEISTVASRSPGRAAQTDRVDLRTAGFFRSRSPLQHMQDIGEIVAPHHGMRLVLKRFPAWVSCQTAEVVLTFCQDRPA